MNLIDPPPALPVEPVVDPPSEPLTEPLTPEEINDPAAPYGYFKNGKPRKNPPKGMPRRDGIIEGDTPPRPRKVRGDRAPKEGPEFPPFRAGPIAKGMNRLYFKAGRLIAIKNPTVGQAFINSTLKVDDEDLTVGDAWEEIARTNPKIRAFLMRLLEGNAWLNLFMAHLPILLAIMHETGMLDNMPLGKLLGAFMAAPVEETPANVSDLFSTLSAEDAAQIAGIAQGMFANITAGQGGVPRPPTVGQSFFVDDPEPSDGLR